MPRGPWTPRRSGHFIVCGGDSLAIHLVEELRRLDENVTLIAPREDLCRAARNLGASVVEAVRPDAEAFGKARLATARAVSLVHQDDVGNIHAALSAQELNPELRIVVRMFNVGLGERVRPLFTDATILSDAAIAAPSFVAAALNEIADSASLSGRTVYVAHRERVSGTVLCPLANSAATGGPHLLPDDPEPADLVLAIADHEKGRSRRSRTRRNLAAIRRTLFARRLWITLAGLFALIGVGTVLYAIAAYPWLSAAYVTILTAAGSGDITLGADPHLKVLQVAMTVVGVTIIPILTAAVVDTVVRTRLTYVLGAPHRRMHGHIVVCGLGNLGSKVLDELHTRGVTVVGVDKNASAPGVRVANQLRVPVVIGDASREATLRDAQVETARSVVAVTDDDVANLEVGLSSGTLRDDLRVVLRLFDGDLAGMVERTFDINVSRSVSVLAAPAFAAAMLDRRVLSTISVGRRVLVVAEVPVSAGSALDGAPVAEANLPGTCRVIGLVDTGGETHWSPHESQVLYPEDRLLVLATRSGLSHVLLARAPTDPSTPDT